MNTYALDVICQDLKTQLLNFMNEIVLQFEESDKEILQDLIVARLGLSIFPPSTIMEYVIEEILPLKDVIKIRDDKFFLCNNILFSKLNKNKVDCFKKIWMSEKLDEDEKMVIWSWIDLFVKLAEKYEKVKKN